MAATLLLAGTSLAVSVAMFAERIELLRYGRSGPGVVVGIDVGAKGLKRVEAEYAAADGRRRIGRDLHATQWFAANEIGDEVSLYYDPVDEDGDTPDILIERGLWIWSNPLFLLVGGLLLILLGVYLARQQGKKRR